MKVLYIDVKTDGHHQKYFRALAEIPGKENVFVLPEQIQDLDGKQYVFRPIDFDRKRITEYHKWIKEVKTIVKKENPDIIHFLYADVFYKYLGWGLEGLKRKYKVVNTIHWLRNRKIERASLCRILRLSTVGIVHTEAIFKKMKENGIKNVAHIEYPNFSEKNIIDKKSARRYFKLSDSAFVMSCVGSTRFDKGLDIFLKALQSVSGNFEVLIAGAEDAISKAEIERLAEPYIERVKLHLSYLSDEELEMAIQAADAIVLPYRKMFNGASGPLGEGVAKEKLIIGPNHGSLGDVIEKNRLGYTFESEDANSLKNVIEFAMKSHFHYTETAMKYKESISVKYFQMQYQNIYLHCK